MQRSGARLPPWLRNDFPRPDLQQALPATSAGTLWRAWPAQIADAHRLEHSLALVVVDVDGLDEIAERLGREAADSVVAEVATRLDESVPPGSVHRLGPGEFALVLSASSANDAEALLGALHGSLEPPPGVERVTLGAGITELAEGEDAQAVLGRAEHALRQAQQVGHGTVVVAVPGATAPRHR